MLAAIERRRSTRSSSRPTSGRATRSASGSSRRWPRPPDRGVEVYAIYDGFANLVVSPRFKRFPATARCCATPSTPPGWRFFDLRRYGRDHRKILVVDDQVGFVGGYNIGTPYATEWRDTHVRITGPGVWDLKRAFADFWNLNRRSRSARRAAAAAGDRRPTGSRGSGCTATCRGCGCSRSGRCTSRRSTGPAAHVWMTHAYFIPDQDFVDAMKAAARRGVDVRLLLPAEVEPRRRRLDLARLLRPAARRRGADLPLPATRWCTPRPRPSTAPGRRSAPRTSTGSA